MFVDLAIEHVENARRANRRGRRGRRANAGGESRRRGDGHAGAVIHASTDGEGGVGDMEWVVTRPLLLWIVA